MSSDWSLYNKKIYSRDVSGRELAIYRNDEIEEYPIYGLDRIGKLKSDVPFYYYKDHLGSVRAIVNGADELVSAQDYDMWGYLLQDRSYESDQSKFKFTGKERDAENNYDYFGARYYDSRIGRWGQEEPLLVKSMSFSSYAYGICNPLKNIDMNGLDYYVFNEEGKYVRTEKNEQNYLVTEDSKYGFRFYYEFNDPKKDVKDIQDLIKAYGSETKLVYEKSESDLMNIYFDSGIFDESAQEYPTIYVLTNSGDKGKMDYWYSYIGQELNTNGISVLDINNDRGAFYIINGNNNAYNPMDAGNFYWGGATNLLGISLDWAKFAADVNNFVSHRGGNGIYDSYFDQKAIEAGYKNIKNEK